jgi:hypothetical protein
MWLLDFAVSITLPFFLLAISLRGTQWLLTHSPLRSDHPALRDPVAEQQAEARRHALFELPRESQKKPGLDVDRATARNLGLEIEIQAARRRMTGL